MRPGDPRGAATDRTDETGPVVRPYAVTGGRVRPLAGGFDVVAFIRTLHPDAPHPPHLQPEHRAILTTARQPVSVAELSAHLDIALGVVRVLLGDLLAEGLISVHEPPGAAHLPDAHILKAVVHGLRAL